MEKNQFYSYGKTLNFKIKNREAGNANRGEASSIRAQVLFLDLFKNKNVWQIK